MAVNSIATKSFLMAAAVAAAPKSVGGLFRVWDDHNAPWPIEKGTIKREGLTVAQVALYGVAIERAVKGMESIGRRLSHGGESNLLSDGLRKLQGNQALFLIGLSCTANFIAEAVSRKLAPRNIWNKPGINALINLEPSAKAPTSPELCEDAYTAPVNLLPLFKSNSAHKHHQRHHQPVSFTSRPAPALAPNPFQNAISTPPVARSPFSV
jgi:hypothetical protein